MPRLVIAVAQAYSNMAAIGGLLVYGRFLFVQTGSQA